MIVKTLKAFFRLVSRLFRISLLVSIILGSLLAAAYVLRQDDTVRVKFEGKRWSLPARVFARPLELYAGKVLTADDLEKELRLLRYKKSNTSISTGRYTRVGNNFVIHTRGFQFAEDKEPERLIRLSVHKSHIKSLSYDNNKPLSMMQLEPILIGNFYPRHNQDRVLVRLSEVPLFLIEGLIAVEDKNYYRHFGINPTSIIRAMIENVKQGRKVQGGSTLTQQLVKNYFLSNEQTYGRKVNEAIMSMLLELHYSKNEILEAYLNEIYLGQNGKRSIHGFGLASQFYFGSPLKELLPEQIALLIGIAKGASHYNPRRYPARALKRRNLVLDIMVREGVLAKAKAEDFKKRPLGVNTYRPASVSPFPAYLDLVKIQLRRDYEEEVLHSEGLMVFTAMDPIIQIKAEKTIQKRLLKLEKKHRIGKNKLNAAMLISTVGDSEVVAVVGGRRPRYAGYNRALDAKRQIGSIVKPAVYLTALEKKRGYTLAKRINDAPVTVKVGNDYWKPGNYDHEDLGGVLFSDALVMSRNTPTVRIGIKTGLDNIIQMLHRLGIDSNIPPYPSILLGTSELAPVEVQQMYQTLASGGFYTPIKAIRKVMDSNGDILKRFPVKVKQVASPESIYLLGFMMNQVTKVGTARYLSNTLPKWKNSAGKTGTTNNKRDSWYAGFTGEHVMTVWVGRDDNKTTNLTGASGALRVWSDIMKRLPTKPYRPKRPKSIRWIKIDKESGLLYNPECGTPISLPFTRNTAPRKMNQCEPPKPIEEAPETPVNNGALTPQQIQQNRLHQQQLLRQRQQQQRVARQRQLAIQRQQAERRRRQQAQARQQPAKRPPAPSVSN